MIDIKEIKHSKFEYGIPKGTHHNNSNIHEREKVWEKKKTTRKKNRETFKQDPVKFQKYFIYTYFYENL